ncbi:DnaB domain protein helicase domain protein [Caldicellulosiruptor acetigenus I77R1B]|uniref:DnaB domain protein helicase domain protein n=1 Tax=Caldicellulosiruptor acetigenus (strain ATCC 700853 / DSM 12137 / I77R1B) TaxID=632335 RepID=E4S5U5_CALA7|nr:DnaB-like helicase C-terminal domain-containing protein [Caldicellulosiruptor acetigenus]ADQ41605.1 DnaB domain protein helicase domain protein [Caldicellulosiruptor acetigenus I77R1B]
MYYENTSILEETLLVAWLIGREKEYLLQEFEFENRTHQEIFKIFKKLYLENPEYNTGDAYLALPPELREYMLNLECNTPTTAAAGSFAKELLRISEQKKIRRLLKEIAEQEQDVEPAEVVERLMNVVRRTNTKLSKKSVEVIEEVIERIKKGEKDEKILTGYTRIDGMLRLHRGNLVIIAARPAMGKSAFAVNLATNLVIDQYGKPRTVVYVSAEMTEEEIIDRFTACFCPVPIEVLERKDTDAEKYYDEAGTFACYYPVHIVDKTTNFEEIRTELERIRQKEGKLDIVIVDYLQRLNSKLRFESRRHEIEYISSSLKSFAKQENCVVIALAQLSRAPDNRADHRPVLSDLREAGGIESDADKVMFIYRESYYNKEANENEAEIIIAKNRQGKIGTIDIYWAADYQLFYEGVRRLRAREKWDRIKEAKENERPVCEVHNG